MKEEKRIRTFMEEEYSRKRLLKIRKKPSLHTLIYRKSDEDG